MSQFQPWKGPNRILLALFRLFGHSTDLAEELPAHKRAERPVLTDVDVQWLLDWTHVWAMAVQTAEAEYRHCISGGPLHGEYYAHGYREAIKRADTKHRLRVERLLTRVRERQGDYEIPDEEIHLLYDYAEHYKEWSCRRFRPYHVGGSDLAYRRARWFFVDYMLTWSRHEPA